MKSKAFLGLIGISLASFLTAIDFAIVNTALPSIQTSLHASLLQLQWMMNIYSLVLCAGMVTMGKLADIIGRKIVLITGIIIFAAASFLAGIVDNLVIIIAARALQGIGSAIIVPCSLGLISNLFEAKHRSKAIGIWSAFNGIGFAIGPVLGGILVSTLSWRWVFFIVVPFALISLVITLKYIPQIKAHTKQKIDYYGFTFLTISISSLVFTLIQGPSWGWTSPRMLLTGSTAIISFIGLFIVEQKSKDPIIHFHYFINRQFICSTLANGAVVAVAVVSFFLLPLYLQTIRNEAVLIVGLMLLPITAAMTISSALIEKMVTKIGDKNSIIIGLISLLVAFIMQAIFKANSSITFILIAFILFGIGWGTIWGSATNTAISAFPENDSSTASGLLWTLQNIMGAVGLALSISFFRMLFSKHIWIQIHGIAKYFTPNQQNYFNTLRHDPEAISKLNKIMPQQSIHTISSIFKESFMSSFSLIMWGLSIAIVIITIIVMTTYKPHRH